MTAQAILPATAQATARAGRRGAPLTIALLVCQLLLQRIAVPLGEDQVPVTLPVSLALLAAGFVTGEFRVRPGAARGVLVLWGTAFSCTLVAVASGLVPSLFSLLLVVAIYPVAGMTADLSASAVRRVENVFFGIMVVAAAVSLVQLLIQVAGVPYEDYLLRVVPVDLLQQGFNTGDPIAYGESLYRSNGVLFLEPSFVSAYLGLATALALYRGRSALLVSVLLAGMLPPLAGSGFVVLLPAVLVMAFSTKRRRNLLALAPALVIALVVALTTPLGERYVARSDEGGGGNTNTSTSLRLLLPYESLLPPSVADVGTAFTGHGAGSAEDYLRENGLSSVTAPLLPKVAYEYGILGVVGIVGALVALLAAAAVRRPWIVGVAVLFLYVNASFLQNTLVMMAFFWASFLPYDDDLDGLHPVTRADDGAYRQPPGVSR
ncbi:MAG: hypothetical protein F2825_11490 [Actinobacteria bacterium]|uniref:Unannotated protein n=1 Tax=freshwater metagenome TaxID=449393 RepID=A0A6J7IW37_9ZZZZ|nr:hypothetical protein [Actinomycetota bacterium]